MKWEVRTMRSGTSFFDRTVLKKTVFRFWPLWGAYLAMWLVALPLNGLMILRMTRNGWSGYGASMEYFAIERVPRSVTDESLMIFVVFGVLAAMAVFSHLYNARSANLFGSLPVRREGLFLTHYLAGLAFLIVPNVIVFLLTLAVEAAGGYVVMRGLLFWLAVACGEGFFFYSLAVFCAMFTGHILALPAFYAIVNFLVLAVTELVHMLLRVFYYGFSRIPQAVYTVVEWFTPVAQLQDAVRAWTTYWHENVTSSILFDGERVLETEGLVTVGIYALAAVALAVCAFLLYRVRRLESAGDVVSVKVMRPVFKYGVALCSGLALGMGTVAMIGGGEVTLMVATVIWGAAGYFAAEMLLEKSFKVLKKWKGAAAVTAVFIAVFLVVSLDLTGFETRIPDPDSVDSVNVYGLEVMYLQDDGDYVRETITDPEVIRLITLLHKEAVEQRDEERQTQAMLDGVQTSLEVTYQLKNGSTLSRDYWVWVRPNQVDQEGTAAWALQQIYNNRELCWQMYGFDRLEKYLSEGGLLTQAEHTVYSEYRGNETDAVYYGNDAVALLAAVKEDFFAGRIGARQVVHDRWEYYEGMRDGWETLCFTSDSRENDNDYYYYICIALSDTASSTRAALEEMADRAVRPGTPYSTQHASDVIEVRPEIPYTTQY